MRRQIAAALCTAVSCTAVSCTAVLGLAVLCLPVLGEGGAPTRATARPALPATLVAGSSNTTRTPPVRSSVKDLMESIIDPSADTLWGAVGTVIDLEGVHETIPKKQEEWLDVRHAAIRMIEGATLLMMPDREAAPAGTKSEVPGVELEPVQMTALIRKKRKSFDGFAKALQGLGVEALQASDAKNVDLLMDIGARMENVCEGCHMTFWYPHEK
jgi:hypothetical protein